MSVKPVSFVEGCIIILIAALATLLLTSPLQAQEKILNFDKQLTGTDKIIFIYPPPHTTWKIIAASAMTEGYYRGITFRAWIEDAPYNPYRNPLNGEMIGCFKCLTLVSASAETNYFFPIVGGVSETGMRGQDQPITISWPNRIGIAMTPIHGALPQDIMLFVRIQIQ